ncbi:MAG: transcriptional regulator, PucR family [Solirubrobacterales bacterium]|nr:transcriptional regulator, PucR family [Solirubrobacterales bacterium]
MTGDMLPESPPDTRAVTHITVRHALGLPVMRRGMPLVVAGHDALDRPIRWVHAGEVAYMASMVIGGEMLLMTGMAIGSRAGEQRRFIEGLAERQVAALVIELGTPFPELPPAMIDAAERSGLPLVALRREIPFIAVTEAIHTEIVSSHYALLRRGEQIQRRLTALMLDGEGIPEVLSALAATLRAPVFLEGVGGRLLSHALPPGYDLEPLDVWEATRGRADPPAIQSALVRMGTHQDGGRLLVADLRAPFDALATVALDHAADIVALALLRARQEEELVARERGSFLANLADGRIAPDAVPRAAHAAGLETVTPLVLPIAADVRAGIASAPGEWSTALRDARQLLADRGLPAVVGRRTTTTTILALLALRDSEARAGTADLVAAALRAALERRLGPGAVTIAVGRAVAPSCSGPELRRAEESAASATRLPDRPWHDVAALELRRLLWSRRDDADLADLVQRVLGPLLAHDRQRKLVLLPTLEALLANGGRKAETARALHLNRQALYHRLTRIEQLLGIDLSDADQLLTLHVALYARGYVSQVP